MGILRKIILPESVTIPRKKGPDKKYRINLNEYRNWHYFVSNNIKYAYCNIIKMQLIGLKINEKISLEFTLYRKDNRKVDRANMLSIHEKFFCDALLEMGCLPDDSDEYIESTKYKTSPNKSDTNYVEVEIRSVNN